MIPGFENISGGLSPTSSSALHATTTGEFGGVAVGGLDMGGGGDNEIVTYALAAAAALLLVLVIRGR